MQQINTQYETVDTDVGNGIRYIADTKVIHNRLVYSISAFSFHLKKTSMR